MNFYQKPIYNYKLNCQLDPERSMETLEVLLSSNEMNHAWVKMLDSYD